MKRWTRPLCGGIRRWCRLAPLLIAVAGCSWMPGVEREPQADAGESVPTLADLEPAVMPDPDKPLPAVDLDTLITTYRDVLAVTDDPELQLRVRHRLAGLEMQRGEQRLYEEDSVGGQFELAIAAYRSLLEKHPDHPKNDQLLYQLSKAHDLGGDPDASMAVLDRLVAQYPDSPHYAEAQFRRGEIFFSRGDYRQAEQAYGEVIDRGHGNVHYANALYMHGWSQFKRERYRASLQSFTAVLDLYVPRDNDLGALEPGQAELTRDTFRIMSVVFSYLDGPQTIARVYNNLGERHYMPLLYSNLGELYLEKERYKDSAEAYRAYVDHYPDSDQAPVFYASLIDAYLAGGFSEEVLREKERYVELYGLHSTYWAQKSEAGRDAIRPFLKQYLPELARHYHARAQQKSARLVGEDTASDAEPLGEDDRRIMAAAAIEQYRLAGDYYREFIDTFPLDEQVPEIYFLLAESRFAAENYVSAVQAYEVVAYKYPDHERGAVAGYSAILSYGRVLQNLPDGEANPEHETWLRRKIASQLRFAGTFRDDPRSAAVLTRSAEELLALDEYTQALEAATQLVRREPPEDPELRKTAWLVIGHSEFELQQYPAAEAAYGEALQLIAAGDPARPEVVERLAASVYKQAEQALAAGNPEFAAQKFLRVAEVAPAASIAQTARFDAADTLMNAGIWTAAIAEFERFRRDFPDHSLSDDIPAKMVVAYQEAGEWEKAADELTAIYQSSEDEAEKRESLYRAAELYEQAGDKATAIARYRTYAHSYPEPFAIAMEARFKLNALYAETGQPDKRRYWLRQMIAAHDDAGQQRTERSRYLAAMSATVLADDAYRDFADIPLTLPLKSSLKKKKGALEEALASYKKVTAYGVEEFATLATYRIGEIYRQLSRDLLDSQRPDDLDALALEQYELLLEEQAYPFEEKAISIHETNSRRSWQGIYDQWVKQSFESLAKLLPARYGKQEREAGFTDAIH